MTTFRNINDTEVAVDAPLTQQLMQALKDNPTALAEGSTNAPRVTNNALFNNLTPASGTFVCCQVARSQRLDTDYNIEFQCNCAGTYKFQVEAHATLASTGGGSSPSLAFTIDKDTGSGYADIAVTFTEVIDSSSDMSFLNNGATNHEVQIGGHANGANFMFSFELTLAVDDKIKISGASNDASHVVQHVITCDQRLPLGTLISVIYP